MRGLAPIASPLSLAARRLWNRRLLMLCLLLGRVAAVGLPSGIPRYAGAAQNKLLQAELQSADAGRASGDGAPAL